MNRPSHDEYYLQILKLVAGRSTCARRAVGAIIVDANFQILSTGYNGVPRNFPHCTDEPCLGRHDPKGDSSRCLAVHAEENALLQCARLDLARTIYTSCVPCFGCAKKICNTSIKRVVARESYADPLGMDVLKRAGIEVMIIPAASYAFDGEGAGFDGMKPLDKN